MIKQNAAVIICLAGLLVAMAAGFAWFNVWWGVLLTFAIVSGFVLSWRRRSTYGVHLCLLGGVGLAVSGLLNGVSLIGMTIALSFSLAAWDLILKKIDPAVVSGCKTEKILDHKHLIVLSVVGIASLGAALLVSFISVNIPFWGIMALVVLAGWGVQKVWGTLKRLKKRY